MTTDKNSSARMRAKAGLSREESDVMGTRSGGGGPLSAKLI